MLTILDHAARLCDGLTRRKQEACERVRECLRRKGITRELFG